jgi:hypothetical protein
MSIEAEFLRENKLIIVHFGDTLDLGEYIGFITKTHAAYYDNASAPIHAILDLTKVKGLPRNVLSNAKSASRLKHKNDGLIVFVAGGDAMMRFLSIFLSLTREPNHRSSQSVEDALAQVDAVMYEGKSIR